jgi:hypothetical protein
MGSEKNEPQVPKCIQSSGVLWVNAGADINAPEELVLDLMRSVFFEDGPPGKKQMLLPDLEAFTRQESVVIRGFRGRQKLTATGNDVLHFYNPVYPQLCRAAWLRSKASHVVQQFLFGGVVCDHFSTFNSQDELDKHQQEFVQLTIDALLGDTAASGSGNLFSGSIEKDHSLPAVGEDKLKKMLSDRVSRTRRLGKDERGSNGYLGCEFSDVAFHDWLSLMELEPHLSRHHWVALLSCYLRIVVPMAALVQTRGIVLFDQWLRNVLNGDKPPSQYEIVKSFQEKGRGLLRPRRELCTDHFGKIEEYMRARIRVSQLLGDLRSFDVLKQSDLNEPLVVMSGLPRTTGIESLLQTIFVKRDIYRTAVQADKEIQIGDVDDFVERRVSRLSERFSSWLKPNDVGAGKLLTNLMYPMYCIGQFDERGSHLMVQPGRKREYRIEPGPLVLQYMTLMKHMRMQRDSVKRACVLRDIEEHFQSYGIDYSASPSGRSLLVSNMKDIGLLVGSADAGESARIKNPYREQVKNAKKSTKSGVCK